MSRRASIRRSVRRMLLAAVGLFLVSSLFPVGSATAHVFTKLDGNDSRGKLDLRSVAVSHTPTSVVHRISTYNAWTARSLGSDSFFVIQIDKNNDRNYERCAFIFYTNKLRGSLSNCGARFLRYLPVAKLSGTAARVTIPKSETGGVYWWGAASLWDGPRPCARGCVDFAPNNFPDILHDLTRPIVAMDTGVLRIWESSTTSHFTFPFWVSDAHAGIQSWTVQRRAVGSATWSNVITGFSAGSKEPPVFGEEATNFDYRVVAKDKHGNKKIGPTRRVYIPTDDDDPIVASRFSVAPATATDATAFGGSYSEMSSGTFTYTWTPGTDCLFELIGPGSGDYWVRVIVDGQTEHNVRDEDFPDQPRLTLFSHGGICGSEYVVTMVTGTFPLDAVLASSG